MSEVTMKGNAVQVGGSFPKIGQQAADFSLTDVNLQEQKLSSFAGKRKIINVFPSVDTGVCAQSVRPFNQDASELDNTVVLCVSADLPFAQARFCGAEGLNNVTMLSVFRHPEFKQNFGVDIQSGALQGLCARGVVVLDETDKVVHAELVPEISQEPDYDAALKALQS